MANVINIPTSSTLTVEQALAEASKREWSDVLVCGYVGNAFAVLSSRMSRQDALWLSRMLADWAIEG